MTVLSWPLISRIAPGSVDWGYVSNTTVFTSPLSKSVQTIETPAVRWRVSFMLENLSQADSVLLEALLLQLRGASGRVALHHFARPSPRGTLTGTPLVKGAGQTGNSLLIDGCTVGATLLAGDFIGVNGELKMLVAAATASGSGEMTLFFEPPLRAAPADNAAITLVKPTATFKLEQDEGKLTYIPAMLSNIPFSFVEAWE